MALSGNVNFTLNRNQIVQGALRLLGQLAEGETATAQQTIDGALALNRMIKAWAAQDIHLWKYGEAILFLAAGQHRYQIDATTTDNVTETYVRTALDADVLAGSTSFDVEDATGISNNDYIGITLQDSTFQWTQVNGAPVGNTITVDDALTEDALEGAYVYAYTTKLNRPDMITQIRRFNDMGEQDQEIQMNIISRREYFMQTDKDTQSEPVQGYVDKQLNYIHLYLWPTPDGIDEKIKFTYQRPFEIFDSAADDADFPSEWLEAVTFNLAVRLAPEYGVPLDERAYLKAEATQYLNDMLTYDREPVSIYVQPSTQDYPNDSN